MKVSVIIPFYNEEEYLKKCLESLKNQSFQDFEVIVIDDGSTDETVKKIKQLNNLTIFSQKHQGPGPARNLGASKARGEILVFIDADMIFEKDFLKTLIEPIEKGKARGTFSKEEYVANWENPWARCWSYNLGVGKRLIPENYPEEAPVFRAILKKEFDRVKGFSPVGDYTDDWTLAKKLGYKAQVASAAVYFHHNPGSLVEVFTQSKWIGKRKRKLNFIGYIFNIVRRLLPFSLLSGLDLSRKHKTPRCLVFRIVYDLGELIGSLRALTGRSLSK